VDITNLVAASAAGATVISTILSAMRSDNTILRAATSTRTRVLVAVGLGVLQLVLMTIAKQPVTEAVVSAIASTVTAIVASAAPRAVAGLVLFFVITSTTACDAFTPKRVHGAAELVKCALENRMMQPADIAVKCGFEHVQDVVDVIAGEDQRMGTARSLGVAEGRQLGAAACTKR